ncbi:MAG: bacteriophage Gp15 family protein [Prevotella sp.]|nr:bacteriophage Gp15 family protein [Prevotella sp.]
MSLTEATEFVKIMQYRGTDVSKIKCKEEKARIKKLQERYALRSQKIQKFATLNDRNEAFRNRLLKRYEEVQKQLTVNGV